MQLEFEVNNNEQYKINGSYDNTVNAKKSIIGQLLGFYYLVLYKNY